MSPVPVPQTFRYQHVLYSPKSWLWGVWLSLPSSWRGRVYGTILRVFGEQIPFTNAYRVRGYFFKLCPTTDEALTTEYVRAHTSIPVAKVLDVVRLPKHLVTPKTSWVMISTAVAGTPLFVNGSGHRLRDAPAEKAALVSQSLKNWLDQLRQLESPCEQRVCGFTGGNFRNFRIGEEPVGPFASIEELNSHPSLAVPEAEIELNEDLSRLVDATKNKAYRFHLVHGDLVLHNVMADDDLRPTGIIDWECAAWMPEYWEALSSSRGAFREMQYWKDVRRSVFQEYKDEMDLDTRIQKLHGGE
ncbi:Mediator of RNA polymerase II transcription subunit 13 [Mycena indigotica]|uniref:Mediator of RNA polymerase II transcription subunit 13 n=1 Tax=Mycena indigotica TaxID=2126181 RepID=A0A8H6S737_9AGAR|nr:Mediator of RNA polymerase II transcription subunit 13 [Mycena indigotica]KAF7293022.1 Mediator of RNA polymerase II transcription subunit 13 [Mycena indigotica]